MTALVIFVVVYLCVRHPVLPLAIAGAYFFCRHG